MVNVMSHHSCAEMLLVAQQMMSPTPVIQHSPRISSPSGTGMGQLRSILKLPALLLSTTKETFQFSMWLHKLNWQELTKHYLPMNTMISYSELMFKDLTTATFGSTQQDHLTLKEEHGFYLPFQPHS
jgi:hypothetical protein